MRLSELMSQMSPTTFTVIGLVLFIAVFAAVVVRAYWPGTAAEHDRANRLPLEGDQP
jgi:cbb3-type cytochrome oxidase subunit 3